MLERDLLRSLDSKTDRFPTRICYIGVDVGPLIKEDRFFTTDRYYRPRLWFALRDDCELLVTGEGRLVADIQISKGTGDYTGYRDDDRRWGEDLQDYMEVYNSRLVLDVRKPDWDENYIYNYYFPDMLKVRKMGGTTDFKTYTVGTFWPTGSGTGIVQRNLTTQEIWEVLDNRQRKYPEFVTEYRKLYLEAEERGRKFWKKK